MGLLEKIDVLVHVQLLEKCLRYSKHYVSVFHYNDFSDFPNFPALGLVGLSLQ